MQAAVGKCCVCCSPHWLPKATDSCSLELTCCTEHQSLPTSVSVHLSPVSTTVCHLSPCLRDTHWLLWGLLLLVRMETQKGDMTALPRRKHLECKLHSSLLLPQDHRIHKLPHLPPALPFFSRGGLRTRVVVRPLRSPFLPIATE